jgi:hypothetical protein
MVEFYHRPPTYVIKTYAAKRKENPPGEIFITSCYKREPRWNYTTAHRPKSPKPMQQKEKKILPAKYLSPPVTNGKSGGIVPPPTDLSHQTYAGKKKKKKTPAKYL